LAALIQVKSGFSQIFMSEGLQAAKFSLEEDNAALKEQGEGLSLALRFL
jgi:hypothetical protein